MVGRVGWQAGPAGYLFTTLSELRRFSNRRVSLTIDGFTSAHDILFIAIANGAYYGGGMRIAPDARPDDGLLDVCVVGDISRLTALRQLPNLYRGTHVHHRQVTMRTGAAIEIDGMGDTRSTSTVSRSAASSPACGWCEMRSGSRHRRCGYARRMEPVEVAVGSRLSGRGGRRIGTVDAVFADYLLVRTAGLLPVDLYVPRPEVRGDGRAVSVDCSPSEAYERWHRPLKRAPHDGS